METVIKVFFSAQNIVFKLSSILIIIAALIPNTAFTLGFSLESVQTDIEEKYQNIKHIDDDNFLKLDSQNTLIFDVREKSEFNVSHIKNAIQITPNIDNKEFIKQFSQQIKGKHLVFYCSVGQRSSALASRLKPLLISQGVHGIYNLKGGIFKWHNKKRPLVQQGQSTQFIHPFNSLWGLLLKNRQFIKHQPDTPTEKNAK